MNRAVLIIVGVVILVVASGASFYGGMVYGEGRAQSARTAGGALALDRREALTTARVARGKDSGAEGSLDRFPRSATAI